MTRCISRSALAVLMLSLVGWSIVSSSNAADDAAPAQKARAKARGQLPDYYSAVVDPEQREKIYSIQQSYASQIDALRDQLKTLADKRDAEMAAVLTDAQRQKVEALKQEGKAKASAKKKDAPGADAPPTAAK